MNPFKNRPLLFCSLILYTLLLTAALLYLRFPAEDFKHFCQSRLEQLLPGTRCTINEFRYVFPLGMEIESISFTEKQGNDQPLFAIDRALIQPKLFFPISQFHVALTAYDGEHDFSIFINKAEQTYSADNIRLAHLNLEKIPLLRKTFNREITGSLSGNGSYQSAWNSKNPGRRGQGHITIEKGSFSLLFPILSLEKIDLQELQTDFSLQKERIAFSKGHFRGKELEGEFTGDLTLAIPFTLSELAFSGLLEPLPPLLKKSKYAEKMVFQVKKQHNRFTLPFLLQGNVQRPRFKFDSL